MCNSDQGVAGNRDITPLFARLFADLEISKRETSYDGPQIDTVSALIESYVVGLNRGIKEARLPDHKILTLAKWISWIEIKPTLKPRVMARAELIKAAGGEEFTDEVQDYLERKLRFLRSVDGTGERFRVSFDPVAEHLAASCVLASAAEGKLRDLEDMLKYVSTLVDGELMKKSGFLVALWEAWNPLKDSVRLRNDRLNKERDRIADIVRQLGSANGPPKESAAG